jgi:hypothetical protein
MIKLKFNLFLIGKLLLGEKRRKKNVHLSLNYPLYIGGSNKMKFFLSELLE